MSFRILISFFNNQLQKLLDVIHVLWPLGRLSDNDDNWAPGTENKIEGIYFFAKQSFRIILGIINDCNLVFVTDKYYFDSRLKDIMSGLNVLMRTICMGPDLESLQRKRLKKLQSSYENYLSVLAYRRLSSLTRTAKRNVMITVLNEFGMELFSCPTSLTLNPWVYNDAVVVPTNILKYISDSVVAILNTKENDSDIIDNFIACEELISANLSRLTDKSSNLPANDTLEDIDDRWTFADNEIVSNNTNQQTIRFLKIISRKYDLEIVEKKYLELAKQQLNESLFERKTTNEKPERNCKNNEEQPQLSEVMVSDISTDSSDQSLSNDLHKIKLKTSQKAEELDNQHVTQVSLFDDSDTSFHEVNWAIEYPLILKELTFI